MRKLLACACLAVLLTAPASAQTGGAGSGPVLCGISHTPRMDETPCADPPQTNGISHTPLADDASALVAAVLLDMAAVIRSITGH